MKLTVGSKNFIHFIPESGQIVERSIKKELVYREDCEDNILKLTGSLVVRNVPSLNGGWLHLSGKG